MDALADLEKLGYGHGVGLLMESRATRAWASAWSTATWAARGRAWG
jgi:hypothetical protein